MRLLSTSLALAALLSVPAFAMAPEGPIVAVIDTGIEATPLLAPMLIASYDMSSRETPRTTIANPHGTMVASVIALNATKPFRLVSLRADGGRCNDMQCEMNEDSIERAVRKAIEIKADIIQISTYGDFGRKTRQAFVDAAAAGIQVVFCAGNKGGPALPVIVAREAGKNVHVVGSLDPDGRHSEFSASTAKRRFTMEWRLGVNVATQDLQGRDIKVTGTSFSAPLLAAELVDAR